MEIMKKLDALQNVAEFEQELSMVSSPEELQELFKKHGVDLSKQDVENLLANVSVQTSDELSDIDLEGVAGGSVLYPTWLYRLIAKWVLKNGRWVKVIVKG